MKRIEKKRFLVFGMADYYPGGAFSDYMFSVDTLDELIAIAKEDKKKEHPDHEFIDEFQIFDTKHFLVGSGEKLTQAFSDLSNI